VLISSRDSREHSEAARRGELEVVPAQADAPLEVRLDAA